MRNAILLTALFIACAGLISAAEPPPPALPPAAAQPVDFVKDIKPLFESSCVQCHAKGKEKGGLSLETRESLLKGGDDGPAVIVGKSEQSKMVALVAGTDPDSVMPKKGKRWTPRQVGLLRAWIDQGMAWDKSVTFARPEPANLRPRAVALPAGSQTHPIDRLLAAYFAKNAIDPPAVVDDRAFCRRAYLDVIGLLPSAGQLESFIASSAPDKRAALVQELLANRRGYADHWLTFWNDLLRNDYRGAGFIDGGRRQITGWLYTALVNDLPYDQFVAQLVCPKEGSEGFSRGIIWRGAVNASQLPPVQAAQNISQVFLGVNLKCASCHDSFVNDYTLADAYGMAALYSDKTLELIHCDKPTGKTAVPTFLYPQIGKLNGAAPKAERLKELAALITSQQDGRLSRTIVNRLWARLLGHGLVEPVDDMDKPAWDPDLLDWLADDLVAHHYDLKHTIALILTSQAYQLPSIDAPTDAKSRYIFRGPEVRRLTAEQYSDAIDSLDEHWPRFPATLSVDFTAGNLIGAVTMPRWIWTDEPVEVGQERAIEQDARRHALREQIGDLQKQLKQEEDDGGGGEPPPQNASADAAKPAKKYEPPKRHKVVFRKRFELEQLPDEAYASLAASQGFSLTVNGHGVGPMMYDGERRGRIKLFDLRSQLRTGDNVIVLEVSSHTEKQMNEEENKKYPASRNHLNAVSGAAFYLRANYPDGKFIELTTDSSWRVYRAPAGRWKAIGYDDGGWPRAAELPDGVAPVDEGPGLEPITRKDFANEPIDLGPPMRSAVSTAAQRGGIRAALLAADPLMTALDRPNREVVMTTRSTTATTLQALELTNGQTLNDRLKQAADRLTPAADKDPEGWVRDLYRHTLSRDPTSAEADLARQMLGDKPQPAAVADLLWAVTQLPEFQYVR